MLKVRNIFAVLVVLSLVFAGIPQSGKASAMQPCPMTADQMDSAKADNSEAPLVKCPKMTEQQKSESKCCGDDACSKQCAAMSLSNASMLDNALLADYPVIKENAVAFYNIFFNSSLLNTQDRPPKSLIV